MATFLLIIFLSFCIVGCGGEHEAIISVSQLNNPNIKIGYSEGHPAYFAAGTAAEFGFRIARSL
ncbi:MAG: hypothetical protein IKQ61_02225 [Spirochaetales bacterium]|nr:hypothetical protein [Spirochaetales bacterium]MBR6199062.1 hypothetical protein [Spirochaetales bacterium]